MTVKTHRMYDGHPAFHATDWIDEEQANDVNEETHAKTNTAQWSHWVNQLYDCENPKRARCLMQMIYILAHENENDYWWWYVS